uniref:Transmembrane protein 184C n=2 Tax=Corethron hystrix TaxID=216773 RepID=A0A7S1B6M0_9STRA|mmetsp:Transcript_14951/g.33301  ORF Transcript_14951/g.33301 Transcript_14951/m.33301 type:complete len:386 (+) Transcript_14951:697-1854(+)
MGQPVRRLGSKVHWTSPFLTNCKFGVLQYVLIRNVTAWITLILDSYDLYDEGNFSVRSSYFYLVFIVNLSQCWALYVLVVFYLATKNELSPINPVGKFLSVKALVFFTWWQSVFINILYQMNFIPHGGDWTSEDVAKGIQDYLICIEMFVASIIHIVVFPHTDYTLNKRIKRSKTISHKKVGRRNLGLAHFRRRRDAKHSPQSWTEGSAASSDASLSVFELDDDDPPQYPSDEAEPPERAPFGGRPPFRLGSPGTIEEGEAGAEEEATDGESDADGRPQTSIMQALIQSTLPKDVVDGTIGMVKGDFIVDQQTLLRHTATIDNQSLFSMPKKYPASSPRNGSHANDGRGPGQRKRYNRQRSNPPKLEAAFVLNSGMTDNDGHCQE